MISLIIVITCESLTAGKQLRKRVSSSKAIDLKSFLKFAGEKKASVSTTCAERAGLAKVPLECPSLPSSFRHRPHAEAQLAAALLDADGRRSTSLTAPKSRISSQGMGQYQFSSVSFTDYGLCFQAE